MLAVRENRSGRRGFGPSCRWGDEAMGGRGRDGARRGKGRSKVSGNRFDRGWGPWNAENSTRYINERGSIRETGREERREGGSQASWSEEGPGEGLWGAEASNDVSGVGTWLGEETWTGGIGGGSEVEKGKGKVEERLYFFFFVSGRMQEWRTENEMEEVVHLYASEGEWRDCQRRRMDQRRGANERGEA